MMLFVKMGAFDGSMSVMRKQGHLRQGQKPSCMGGLACCAGSSGPGHVHLINGVYDAHRSGASVLVIASALPSGEFGTQYFQETNTIRLFDDCSYYNQVATTPQQFPRMLQGAIQAAVPKKELLSLVYRGIWPEKGRKIRFLRQRCFRLLPGFVHPGMNFNNWLNC